MNLSVAGPPILLLILYIDTGLSNGCIGIFLVFVLIDFLIMSTVEDSSSKITSFEKILDSLFSSDDPSFLIIAAITLLCILLSVIYLFKKRGPPELLPLEDFQEFPLIRKEVLSHDTRRFTFGLPAGHVLGLPTGQHLSLKFIDSDGKAVQRSYTPVSDSTQVGEVSLVIKVYRPAPPKFPNGGLMSQHIDDLNIGDTMLIKGPKGHLHYHENGQFQVKPLGKPHEQRKCSQIAMMAGGTGITPMLQILHAIFHNPRDTTTSVKLLYANQTPDDILVRDELETLAKDFPNRFSLWFTVDRPTKDWKYSTGFISKSMVEKHVLFEKNEDTQFYMCGPLPMVKFAVLPALKELGYSEKDWVVF